MLNKPNSIQRKSSRTTNYRSSTQRVLNKSLFLTGILWKEKHATLAPIPGQKALQGSQDTRGGKHGRLPWSGLLSKGLGFQPIRTEPGFWINEQRGERNQVWTHWDCSEKHLLINNSENTVNEINTSLNGNWASLVAQWWGIRLPVQKMQVRSRSGRSPWERKWQPIPVFLPGKVPRTEEPGGLQLTGLPKSQTQLRY